jgi:hypothetical protein
MIETISIRPAKVLARNGNLILSVLVTVLIAASVAAQSLDDAVRVLVADPSGAAITNARATLRNSASHYEATATSGMNGVVVFSNLPVGQYSLVIEASGFEAARRNLEISSGTPVVLNVSLKLAGSSAVVEVDARSSLLDPDAITGNTQIVQSRIEQSPGVGGSHVLQQLVSTAPGFTTENDGLLHMRGVDDGVLYVLDGIPLVGRIDPLTGTSPDLSAISSMTVVTGNIPAEFGGRSGAVVVMEGKSGLASDWMGSLTTGGGSFQSAEVSASAGGSLGKKAGVFASSTYSQSDRFLDPPDPGNFNNHGAVSRARVRFDFRPNDQDMFVISASGAGTGLHVPNTFMQEQAGQRQMQHFRSDDESVSWNRTWSANTQSNLEYFRQSASAQLSGSPFDTPLSAAQGREHTRQGMIGNIIYILHGHALKAGTSFSHIGSQEFFTFAVTDPQNAALQGFGDNVLNFDRSNPFLFSGRAVFTQFSTFVQDSFSPLKNLTINAGLRFDHAHMLAADHQWSPRIAGVYYIAKTATSVRASLNQLFMPPQVENLLLSGSEQARRLSPFAGTTSAAGALVRAEQISAYDVGVSQAFRKLFRLDVDYWRRQFRNIDDPNVLFSTQIIFPNSVAQGLAHGVDVRLEVPIHQGWSGYASYTNSRIVETGPINGGLFLSDNALKIGPGTKFLPDHDQRNVGDLGITYHDRRYGLWATASARYESGVPIDLDPDQLDALRQRPGANLVDFQRARVSPREIFGLSAGMMLLESRHTEIKAQLDIQNLLNAPFVYNFSNPFSGTHFGAPRQVSGRLQFTFR